MRLLAVTVQMFKNIVDSQRVEIEPDVTGLVGKNESGKTTVLKALHRLNPANGAAQKFNVTTEYPRWRLAPDRRKRDLSKVQPVTGEFEIEQADAEALQDLLPATPPDGTICMAARSYANNGLYICLKGDLEAAVRAAAMEVSLDDEDLPDLLKQDSIAGVQAAAKASAKELKDGGEPLRAKAMTSFVAAIGRRSYLFDPSEVTQEIRNALASRIPKFFYFSNYDVLPGQCDLTALAQKIKDGTALKDSERTVVALLAHAGEEPEDFMDTDYDSRKAELQAASTDLSRHVFKYWRQNPDLAVIFDTDNVVWDNHPQGGEITHRYLKIEMRDDRHGGVETNFSTRSTGFQWFFSFFAAFSEYQSSVSRSSCCWTSREQACMARHKRTSSASSSMSSAPRSRHFTPPIRNLWSTRRGMKSFGPCTTGRRATIPTRVW